MFPRTYRKRFRCHFIQFLCTTLWPTLTFLCNQFEFPTKLFPRVNYGGFGGGGEVLHKTVQCCVDENSVMYIHSMTDKLSLQFQSAFNLINFVIIVILLKHSSEAWIPWAISFKEAGKRCLGSPNVLKSWGWVLPTTFAPFIICRNFCWRLDIELGLAYVIVRHENGPNLTYSENCAVLLNFQRPILTRHAQVV